MNNDNDLVSIVGKFRSFFVDYRTPVEELRRELDRLVEASDLWDGNVVNLQVIDATEKTIQLRILSTASSASRSWDLRCELREKLLAYLQQKHPECLPRQRFEFAPGQMGLA